MARSPDATLLLVYLDGYHLGDPLFLQRFAAALKAHEGPLVVLHGAGEAAERALEAEGRITERVDGVLRVEDAAGRALVERAARDLNREVVHALNEAGVAALRVAGTDRGLLKETEAGEVVGGRAGWLRPLAEQGAVPVVALVAARAGEVVEVSAGRAVVALAAALGEGAEPPVVVVLAKVGGEGATLLGALAEPETARWVGAEGVRVRVIRLSALRGAGIPEGVDLPPEGG